MPPSQHDLDEHRRNEQRLLAVLITKGLAECEEPVRALGPREACVLCHRRPHAEDCPWLMAKDWARNNKPVDQEAPSF